MALARHSLKSPVTGGEQTDPIAQTGRDEAKWQQPSHPTVRDPKGLAPRTGVPLYMPRPLDTARLMRTGVIDQNEIDQP